MSRYDLRHDEAEVIAAILDAVAVHPTTGIIGVIHGNNRFVATKHGIDRHKLDVLDAVAAKLGTHPVKRASQAPR